MIASHGISEVEHFLAYLKGLGNLNERGPVDDASEETNGYSAFLEGEVDDPEVVLKSMKALSSTLQTLSRMAEKELQASRARHLPDIYRKGLYSLPFEVLARILELAYDPEDCSNDWERRQALRVNHYFRDVMLKVSKIWTFVDFSSFTPSQLNRSRSRPLIIRMGDISRSGNPFERCLEVLHPHVKRWKSLSIRQGWGSEIDFPDSQIYVHLKHLRDAYRDVTFPALEKLCVDYDRDYLVDDEDIVLGGEDDPNTSIRSFFSSWDMPALRSLEVVGFVPVLPLSCQTTLTNVRMQFHGGEYFFDLPAVADFLRPLVSLEKLTFDLLIEGWLENEMPVVELPSLKSLTIEDVVLTDETTKALLDSINAPNLRELIIRAEVHTNRAGVSFLDAFFPSDSPRWTELDSLSCYLEVTDEKPSSESPFEILCTRLPRLRHLTLESTTIGQPSNLLLHEHFNLPTWDRQVKLSTLRLIDCPLFETSFIINLGNVINTPEFETLEIHRCPKISMDAMRKCLPSDKKFVCSEYNWVHERSAVIYARRDPPDTEGGFARLLRKQAQLLAAREQGTS